MTLSRPRASKLGGSSAKNAGGFRAYSSHKAFRRAMGPAGPGKAWHHIVEQTPGNVENFGPKAIHNTENVVAINKEIHDQISNYYSTNLPGAGKTAREWLRGQSFEKQRAFGLKVIWS